MKIPIYDVSKKEIKKKDLPEQFNESLREDIIKRAVQSIDSNSRQPYGAKPDAGLRASAKISKRRRKYRGCYGFGISRVPRKIMTRRGTRFNWVGAVIPGTVGGRRAHPPKAEKIWSQKINKNERRIAIRSALSATVIKELVKERGHMIPETYPLGIEEKFESLSKTKEVLDILKILGFEKELERSDSKKIRAGKGKARGRKYKRKKGLLIVVSGPCNLLRSANNIPGVDITTAKKLNTKLLAPGADPGRITLFTDKALEIIEKEKLFV